MALGFPFLSSLKCNFSQGTWWSHGSREREGIKKNKEKAGRGATLWKSETGRGTGFERGNVYESVGLDSDFGQEPLVERLDQSGIVSNTSAKPAVDCDWFIPTTFDVALVS